MGTPDFAVPTLKMLLEKHNVTCVVTRQDAQKGRGKKLLPPPVKVLAEEYNIPVLQPLSAKTDEFYEELLKYPCDLMVTCAFGKILPGRVIRLPEYGCINVHAGLLPEYRGAAPLWHCIINGEKETGVTTMFTDEGMDTGDILLVKKYPLSDEITTGELSDILSVEGANLLEETLVRLSEGTLVRTPQDDSKAGYAPMVKKEEGHIDWTGTARMIHNRIRGMEPSPGAFCFIDGERFKLRKSTVLSEEEFSYEPGTIVSVSSQGIDIACGKGMVRILEIQTDSSKKMTVGAYLCGHKIPEGTVVC